MATRRLKRYIAYNIGLWLATALAGLMLLVAVRGYGQMLAARQSAARLLAEGRAALEQDALYEAQRRVLDALDAWPRIADRVVADLGRDLVRLPMVRAALTDPEGAVAGGLGLDAAAALAIADPKLPVRASLEDREGADGALLWLGRAMTDQGDLLAAETLFKKYWRIHAMERAAAGERLSAGKNLGGEELYNAGRRLMFNGLWNEAFETFEAAEKAGYSCADLDAMRGVRAELEGRRGEAGAAYGEALRRLPGHRLAQARLRALR